MYSIITYFMSSLFIPTLMVLIDTILNINLKSGPAYYEYVHVKKLFYYFRNPVVLYLTKC